MTPERSIGQLVADASRDVSDLLRHEIALARAELARDVKAAGLGAALLAGAAFLSVVAFVLLCVAGALGLAAAGLPAWAAFLVMAAILLLLAGVLAAVARGRLTGISTPDRSLAAARDSLGALRGRPPGPGDGVLPPGGHPAATP